MGEIELPRGISPSGVVAHAWGVLRAMLKTHLACDVNGLGCRFVPRTQVFSVASTHLNFCSLSDFPFVHSNIIVPCSWDSFDRKLLQSHNDDDIYCYQLLYEQVRAVMPSVNVQVWYSLGQHKVLLQSIILSLNSHFIVPAALR